MAFFKVLAPLKMTHTVLGQGGGGRGGVPVVDAHVCLCMSVFLGLSALNKVCEVNCPY